MTAVYIGDFKGEATLFNANLPFCGANGWCDENFWLTILWIHPAFVRRVDPLAFGLQGCAEVLGGPGLDGFDAAVFEDLMHDLGRGASDGRAESQKQAREAGFRRRAFQQFLFAERGLQHFGRSREPFVRTQRLALVGHEGRQLPASVCSKI